MEFNLNSPMFRDSFIEMHQDTRGKFQVGQKIKYTGTFFSDLTGKEFKILACNVQDAESVEYLLEGFPFLVWEEELERIND